MKMWCLSNDWEETVKIDTIDHMSMGASEQSKGREKKGYVHGKRFSHRWRSPTYSRELIENRELSNVRTRRHWRLRRSPVVIEFITTFKVYFRFWDCLLEKLCTTILHGSTRSECYCLKQSIAQRIIWMKICSLRPFANFFKSVRSTFIEILQLHFIFYFAYLKTEEIFVKNRNQLTKYGC